MDGELGGWDSPDGRVSMLTKIGVGPNADGEYPADQHYRGRTLTFKLIAASPSEAARENSRYLLAQALDLVGTTGLFVVNEEIPKQVAVNRSGNSNQGKLTIADQGFSMTAVASQVTGAGEVPTPEVDSSGRIYLFETNVEVYSADPRKYAVTPVVETGVPTASFTFTNPGNTETSKIVVTLTSPSGPGGFGVGNGSAVFLAVPTTPGPALPGFPGELILDFYNNTIEDGSGNNFYYLRNLLNAPPWPFFGPGDNTVDVVGAGSTFDFTYYPAWI